MEYTTASTDPLVSLSLFFYSSLVLWIMFTIQLFLICTFGEWVTFKQVHNKACAPSSCPTSEKVHYFLNWTTISTLTSCLNSHQNERMTPHSIGSSNQDKLQIFSYNYKLQGCVMCHYVTDSPALNTFPAPDNTITRQSESPARSVKHFPISLQTSKVSQ